MATIKSYTDLEQSKKLAEILPLESADMYIYKNVFFGALSCFNGTTQIGEYIKLADKESKAYPCWSLAALFDLIPKHIDYNVLRIDINENEFAIWYDEISYGVNMELPDIWMKEPVDACVKMILKLHEQKLL